ncbi:MAG: tyrosine-protein phosphatase [Armatimonadota bacterium]
MIDTHNHILPEIDDGASTVQEALAMARRAVEDGIHTVVCTPHYQYLGRLNHPEDVRQRVASLQEILNENGITLKLLPGYEVPVVPELLDLIEKRSVPTIGDNGRWVLLETPFDRFPFRFRDIVFRMSASGFDPVLAHPERNYRVQSSIDVLNEIVPEETPLQITSHSITGMFGPRAKQCALQLLTSGRPVLIASDAHSSRGRGPVLSEAVAAAAKVIGEEAAAQLVSDIPAAILRGESIWIPPIRPPRRRGFLSAIFSKILD